MSSIIKEYKPSAQLSPFVELFWTGDFNVNAKDLFSQRVIPYGYVELIIHLSDEHCELLYGTSHLPSPDYTIIGLFTKPYDVHFRKRVKVFAIRFKPEGMYYAFGTPASEVQQKYEDMECIAGKNFRSLTTRLKESETTLKRIQLTEQYLIKNINNSKLNLYYLNRAADIIRNSKGMLSLNELAGKVYISSRQLEREFKQKLGISPKQYMRIARLNEVNRRITSGKRIDLTDLSHSIGYSDQSHFIKDFKNITGESPKVFINKKEEFIINPNSAERIDL